MTTSHHELATCEQFQIEEYETIAEDFVRNILGLNPEECWLSDESELDDFSLMGSTFDNEELSWDDFIFELILKRYGVVLGTTRFSLVSLFALIWQAQGKTLH